MIYAFTIASMVEDGDDSGSYKEALGMVYASKWLGAMRQEMESLETNGTWSIVKAPNNKRIMRCKWIFKKKEGLYGEVALSTKLE